MSSIQSVKHFVLKIGPGIFRLSPAVEVISNRVYEIPSEQPNFEFSTQKNSSAFPSLSVQETFIRSADLDKPALVAK